METMVHHTIFLSNIGRILEIRDSLILNGISAWTAFQKLWSPRLRFLVGQIFHDRPIDDIRKAQGLRPMI